MDRHRREARRWAEFDDDAGGVFEIVVVRRPTAAAMLAAALNGTHHDRAFLLALPQWLRRLGRGAHMACLCGRPFGPVALPASYVMLLPHRADPHRVLLIGICPRCDVRYAAARALSAAAQKRLRPLWPAMREIDPAAMLTEGGRA